MVDDTNPFSTFDDFWWEDEMFSERDLVRTVKASKNILEDINEISDNVLRNLRPVDTRTEQEIIEDQHIPIDDRTQHELEDGDYLALKVKISRLKILIPLLHGTKKNLQQQNQDRFLNFRQTSTKRSEKQTKSKINI